MDSSQIFFIKLDLGIRNASAEISAGLYSALAATVWAVVPIIAQTMLDLNLRELSQMHVMTNSSAIITYLQIVQSPPWRW